MSTITPEQRLSAAGHQLPAAPQPRGHYAPFHLRSLQDGSRHLTVSGQTCRVEGLALAGICAPGLPLEPARAAAQVAMRNVLAVVAAACGGALPAHLDVCRLRGFVRSSADFTAHSAVLDAASDVLHSAWPDAPRPARTAVGVGSLPDGAFIEIELDAVLPPAASHPSQVQA
ncbi:Enamine deaminase RidA, house cleaning of reactive enamine intermediates, YjgF/YER057c/UK114 family [Variovorax sp. YR750]|uniref:RidA family protein n=1 Tax=Variovorax sp. YR750 TaxID=1884384 RepID=UPI0008C18FE6|nr:RidA family protein [Variovorax sp. YR750]SEL04742.1 Enamine deaminase RidA, house cleaning of reactive enamine intermediates, YjgF/YER057c/UK114 family [Variovorax sp. YR750]